MTRDEELAAESVESWALDSSMKQLRGLLVLTCPFTHRAGETSSNEEEEPAQKKKRDQLLYVQSEEFQKILNAKSRHGAVLQAVWQSHAW